MKSVFVAMMVLLMATAASAQTTPVKQPSPAMLSMQGEDYRLLLNFREEQIETLNQEVKALSDHQTALNDYLKKCGDQTGCTQPIGPRASK